MSRTDDIINVAGHRLSTAAIEEILAEHPCIAEVAVIGVHDALKGQVPLGLVVLNASADHSAGGKETVMNEAIAMVRAHLGAIAVYKRTVVIDRLPKTRSGKVLRGTMRAIANRQAYTVPATIEDPAVLDDVAAHLVQDA